MGHDSEWGCGMWRISQMMYPHASGEVKECHIELRRELRRYLWYWDPGEIGLEKRCKKKALKTVVSMWREMKALVMRSCISFQTKYIGRI